MRCTMIFRRIPLWIRRSRNRGGLSLLEAAASFLVMSISAVGSLKVFTLGRHGLESDYIYKMAGEVLRAKTEMMIGIIHQIPQDDDRWVSQFDQGDMRGEDVLIDRRGAGQLGTAVGNSQDIWGKIYYNRIEATDDPTTSNTNPDWFDVKTWIVWEQPQQTAWQDGMGLRPVGKTDTITYQARIVPVWLDK